MSQTSLSTLTAYLIACSVGVSAGWAAAKEEIGAAAAGGAVAAGEWTTLRSPDGEVTLRVGVATKGEDSYASYELAFDGAPVLAPSTIALEQRDGVVIGRRFVLESVEEPRSHESSWRPVYGERSTVVDHYREVVLNGRDPVAGCRMKLIFRCYDAGVAFKTEITRDDPSAGFDLSEERTEFRFASDVDVWRTDDSQGEYAKVPLSQMGAGIERPLLVESDSGAVVAITEAKLVDYARMLLRSSGDTPHTILSDLTGGVVAGASLETPWRVVMVGHSAGELLEQNDILLNLSDACAIADTSWIRPGKVLREITLTTAGGMACIDFAVANNFQFIEFDAGWYGHEYDDASDATTITVDPKRTPGPLDLRGLVDHANERGLGVILYVNRRALEKQLDEVLPLYQSWGVRGVKYGFVNVGPQKWTVWLHDAVRKAADHKLMVDIHDNYRPTGFSRTYPNLLNQEGVRGDEASPDTRQTLTSLFARGVAGATDFTICYFADRVDAKWSHAQQLAKAVCFYGPWQFIYWYDTPLAGHEKKQIVPTPEQEFFKRVPTVWDETRVLHGEISEYAVVARRSGDDWFLGAINADADRTLETPLDFLDEGRRYTASIYSDDESVDTVTRVRIDRRGVDASTVLSIAMRANGGQAIHITPAE